MKRGRLSQGKSKNRTDWDREGDCQRERGRLAQTRRESDPVRDWEKEGVGELLRWRPERRLRKELCLRPDKYLLFLLLCTVPAPAVRIVVARLGGGSTAAREQVPDRETAQTMRSGLRESGPCLWRWGLAAWWRHPPRGGSGATGPDFIGRAGPRKKEEENTSGPIHVQACRQWTADRVWTRSPRPPLNTGAEPLWPGVLCFLCQGGLPQSDRRATGVLGRRVGGRRRAQDAPEMEEPPQ
ncbi:hypothetical protein NDU88_006947 [Pleurodeles waltl]|uniref:Uncharacterized protein n=1 Tax=Pleurodeles waltl TaxID=8319 RepID=A0AAV7PSQ6_PLEWA|nr:hypothetical protein NDU88_006947 [Pleurodeles waltl]